MASSFSLKSTVTVHYTGRFSSTGAVFDTTEGRAPLTYVEGGHEVVPGFEAAVAGMEPGERRTVHLEPREAYGERDPMLIMTMPTVEIPRYDELVVGSMIYLMDETGYQRLARVLRVQDDGETVFDFNHPMAGEALDFDLELVSRVPLEGADGGDRAAAQDSPRPRTEDE